MKRIFIIPILVFASFMVLLYGVLPKYSAQQKAKESFLKKEQEVKNRQEYFNGIKNTLSEISAYQETLQKIELSMPGDISLSTLIGFFNQKVSDNGLVLRSITPVQTTSTSTQSFSMALSGGMSSFQSFLKDIETSSRLVSVESFTLKREVGDSSMGINVQIKVFY